MRRQAATNGLRWYDYLYIVFAVFMVMLAAGYLLRALGVVGDFGDAGTF